MNEARCSSRGGVGKSTCWDPDPENMDSLQQREKGKLKSLRSVDLWFTFLHLPALSHLFICRRTGATGCVNC